MKETEIAWLAGILEGEGCFYADCRTDRVYPRIWLDMTDEDIVRRVWKISGVGNFRGPRQNNTGWGRKPIWTWQLISQKEAIWLMELVLPWMGERRATKIREIILKYNSMPPKKRSGRPIKVFIDPMQKYDQQAVESTDKEDG